MNKLKDFRFKEKLEGFLFLLFVIRTVNNIIVLPLQS